MGIQRLTVACHGDAQDDAQSVLELLADGVEAAPDARRDVDMLEASVGDCATKFLHRPVSSDGEPADPAAPNRTILGRSRAMMSIAATLARVSWSDAPVLIQGETGVGKEFLARAVHALSPRAARPFLKLHCAALPTELVESELFGYERIASTGRCERRPGVLEAADGGAVLLEGVGDLDLRLQAKLLQVLQDHTFHRVGGREMIRVDVRVISATDRDLENSILDGSFRDSLYYQLAVLQLLVPPLRQRKEDITDLAVSLLKRHAKPNEPIPAISAELESAMLDWYWPGNIPELENFIRTFLAVRDCGRMARELRAHAAREARMPSATPASGAAAVRARKAAHWN